VQHVAVADAMDDAPDAGSLEEPALQPTVNEHTSLRAPMDLDSDDDGHTQAAEDGDANMKNHDELQLSERTGKTDTFELPNPDLLRSTKSCLHPIEVLLNAPSDPSSYQKVQLSPSWVVLKILEQIDTGDDSDDNGEVAWYSVQFDDSRIDQVSGNIIHARLCLLHMCFRHIFAHTQSYRMPLSPAYAMNGVRLTYATQ
jgi:hypothetical protein